MYDEPLVIPEGTLAEVLKDLPNERGIFLDTHKGNFLYLKKLNAETMAEWNKDESWFNVVCMASRSIFGDFSMHIEETYFPPATPQNDDYKLGWYRWQDIVFAIIRVPIDKRHLLFIGASDKGMRLADGVPHMISGGFAGSVMSPPRDAKPGSFAEFLSSYGIPADSVATFPLQNKLTYTLEPAYKERGAKIAGIGSFKPAPPMPEFKPSVIDEMMERFQRRKRDGKRRKT
jgi:hypothetical protein